MDQKVMSLFEKPITFKELNDLMSKYRMNIDSAFNACVYAAKQFYRMSHELKKYPIKFLQERSMQCNFDRNYWVWFAFLVRFIEKKYQVSLVGKINNDYMIYDSETTMELIKIHVLIKKLAYYRYHRMCVPNSAISGKFIEDLQKLGE